MTNWSTATPFVKCWRRWAFPFPTKRYADKYIGLDDVRAITTMMVAAGRSPTGTLVADLVRAKRPLYMRRTETALVVFEGAEALVRRQAARGPVANTAAVFG